MHCYDQWQTTRVGELSPHYKERVDYNCQWCGKTIRIRPYLAEDGHPHFCNDECKVQWYSNILTQSPEWKDRSRERAMEMLSNGVWTHTNTVPQIAVNNMLDEMSIKYENEYRFGKFSIDNCLTDYGLFIEVMGDYWHCSPIKYEAPINDVQEGVIDRDKRKLKLAHDNNKPILYLWESDIAKHPEVCIELIKMYIQESGVLLDYNSFNYRVDSEGLYLKEDIAVPFQYQDVA